MIENGGLLEPFRPRHERKNTMVRRGSIIVISSLEDDDCELLESFQPRGGSDDVLCDGYDQYGKVDVRSEPQMDSKGQTDDMAAFEKAAHHEFQAPTPAKETKELPEPVKHRGFALDQIWEALPTVSWGASSSSLNSEGLNASIPLNSSNSVNSEGSKTSSWEKVISTVHDAEDFRDLKKKMRASGKMTFGGAHQALLLQNQSRTPPLSPKRPSTQRNNSFNGSRSQSMSHRSSQSMTHLMLQDAFSESNVNLSPHICDDE